MYKILLAIPSGMNTPGDFVDKNGLIQDLEVTDEMIQDGFDVWDDFELILEDEKYSFSFETMLAWDDPDGCKHWIWDCYRELTKYMKKHGYDTSKVLNMYDVFTTGYNVNSSFDDIETAYAWMKFVVKGFKGIGL